MMRHAGETDAEREADEAVYILTLQLDFTSFDRLQALRRRHFPPALNWIPAHLTLLHTLSVAQVTRLKDVWCELDVRPPLIMTYARVASLGRGVAIAVDSAPLSAFRATVMETILGPFTRQDLAPHRSHVTIQNKVDPAAARRLLTELSTEFTPWQGWGEGVIVWRYLGGPWQLDATLCFRQP